MFLSYTWLWQTGQQHSSSFFRISTLLYILHIRLSFGIVHSILIYSTISKITVRPREIGTGGTGATSNHDNEAHRGLDSGFYNLLWTLQNELLFLHTSARARSWTFIVSELLFPIRSHGEYYLKVTLRVLVSPLPGSAPHTTPGDTHANLRRLKSNLSRLIRKSAGDRPDERARTTTLGHQHVCSLSGEG